MKTNQAGALLFAVITAFILTLVVSTLVILTSNQYRIIDKEIDGIAAFYRLQAGMEFAIYNLYNGTATWTPGTPGYNPNHTINVGEPPVNINVVVDPDGISSYVINISTNY